MSEAEDEVMVPWTEELVQRIERLAAAIRYAEGVIAIVAQRVEMPRPVRERMERCAAALRKELEGK
jgi:hypothetical protein